MCSVFAAVETAAYKDSWIFPEIENSAAVFPRGAGNGERLDELDKFGFDNLKNDDRVISIFFANIQDVTFEIGVEVLENGNGRLALEKRFAVESNAISFGGGKELLGDGLLVTAENVQGSDAALDEAAKHAAVFAHGGHQERRFEGGLRDPSDSGRAESAAVAGSEDVHPVGEQAQSFLFGFLVHNSPGRRSALYVNAEGYGKELKSLASRDEESLRNFCVECCQHGPVSLGKLREMAIGRLFSGFDPPGKMCDIVIVRNECEL
jgi:hypothetical protein